MKSNGLIYVVTGVLFLCLCMSGVSAAGQDLCTSHPTVCNTRTGTIFGSIQAAIDATTTLAGDTIAVDGPSGSSYAPFIVSKPLTIQGRDSSNGLPWVYQDISDPAISIGTGVSGVTLDSFKLDASSGPKGSGVYIPAGSSGNTLKNINVIDFQTGIYLDGSNNNMISQCIVTSGNQGMILYGNHNTVQDSTFSSTTSGGIKLGNQASDTANIIHGNTFTGITGGTPSAISVWSPSNTIDSNTFTNNWLAIVTYPPTQGFATNNLIYNNIFQNSPVNNMGDTTNVWNIIGIGGNNIIGGNFLGGNYWNSPGSHQDWSVTCTNDGSGFCTAPYTDALLGINDQYPLTGTVMPPTTGNIHITSIPSGNIVFDGGGTDYSTPHYYSQVTPGDHTVQVTSGGYADSAIVHVNVVAGDIAEASFVLTPSGSAPVLTHQAAIDYGVTNYLGGNTAGNGKQELLVSDDPVPANTIITLLDGSTITSPNTHPTWLVFINEDKNANWGHASEFAFIYDSNVIAATPVMFPPTGIALSHAAGHVPNPAGLTSIMPPFIRDPACTPSASNNYALLISGGGTKETNYARYYNDIAFMYKTLVKDYNYPKNHITVLMSDGSSATSDLIASYDSNNNPVYGISAADLDGDGQPETWTAATKANVQAALSSYNSLDATKNLLIFTTGHGASNTNNNDPSTNQVDLLLWGAGVKISDADFATALQTPAKVSIVMEQCNGGGFKNDLIPASGSKTRVLATAATGAQSSHSNDFSYYWITGVAGHDSVANPANADDDRSGQVSMTEGYTYANKWDPSGPNWANVETPTFSEYGTGAGATQYFSACAPTIPTITVTSPTSGATWTKSTKYTVTWTSENLPTSPAPYVKVELREGSGLGYWQADINTSVLASAGSTGVSWIVPAALPAGAVSDYWVKISTIGSISPPVVGQSSNFAISGVTKSATASLTIKALPSAISTGAEIVIKDSSGSIAKMNGAEQTGKKTPFTFGSLTSDTYTVTVSSSCYYSSTVSVKLLPLASQTKTLTLNGPITACTNGVSTEPYGSIAITSVPEEGYEVFLDGKDMGYGTPVIQDIGTGPHTVTLKADGYVSQDKTVTVTAGGTAHADFTLVKISDVKAQVLILPQPLNIGRTGYFIAFVNLQKGYKAADVIDGSVSCEGAPALKIVRLKLFPQLFAAVFKRQDLLNVPTGNKVPMTVVGKIKQSSGNVFFRGSTTVNVINKKENTKEDVDNVMNMPDSQVFSKFNKF